MVEVQNPQTLALKALLISICNAAIAFGIFGAHAATEVESIGVLVISAIWLAANAMHHKANATVFAAREAVRPAMHELEAAAPNAD